MGIKLVNIVDYRFYNEISCSIIFLHIFIFQKGNLDVTLILERPKVANMKPKMKENIVKLLRTSEGRVNIKARTHEKMDSIGELRSLSCHVVVTLEKE